VQCTGYWSWGWELSWLASFFLGAQETSSAKVQAWSQPLFEAYCSGAWYLYWTENTLYWVAKPVLHRDEQRRLHDDQYAAIESDVENVYAWHGVIVPAFVVVRPDWITLKHIENEDNSEVRRVMIERYGMERYIADSGAKPIHTDSFGKLFSFGDRYFVQVENPTPNPDGSARIFFLQINPFKYDGDAGRYAQAAVASTWRNPLDTSELVFTNWRDYKPDFAA
jgi:hypothetical protein